MNFVLASKSSPTNLAVLPIIGTIASWNTVSSLLRIVPRIKSCSEYMRNSSTSGSKAIFHHTQNGNEEYEMELHSYKNGEVNWHRRNAYEPSVASGLVATKFQPTVSLNPYSWGGGGKPVRGSHFKSPASVIIELLGLKNGNSKIFSQRTL